jgi:hypothetical protein
LLLEEVYAIFYHMEEQDTKVKVGVNIYLDQQEWLRKYSKIKGMPISEAIRRAITDFRLKEELKEVK